MVFLLYALWKVYRIDSAAPSEQTCETGKTASSIEWLSNLLGDPAYIPLLEDNFGKLLNSTPGRSFPKDPYDWSAVDSNPFELFYARLTRVLFYSGHIPFQGAQGILGKQSLTPRIHTISKELKRIYIPPGMEERNVPSVDRRFMHVWTRKKAQNIKSTAEHKFQSCLETGDAHFLKAHFGSLCSEILGMDLFDTRADVKMDLTNVVECDVGRCKGFNSRATKFAIKFNSFNVIVSHQVFEHIPEPQKAMRSLAKLLAPGGILLWSTPFLTKNHGMPYDFQRFTRSQVRSLVFIYI
jgi:SAM-dependent methyltransferase